MTLTWEKIMTYNSKNKDRKSTKHKVNNEVKQIQPHQSGMVSTRGRRVTQS